MYEMVSGARPFHGQSGFELTSAIVNQAPRPLPSQVPAELGAVIERCLEKEPGKRYQQAGELREALKRCRQGRCRHGWGGATGWHTVAGRLLRLVLAAHSGRHSGGIGCRRAAGMADGRKARRAVRLAVLPFANLTGDPEQEYLSDGMTQEMIAQLGRCIRRVSV